MTRKKCRSKYSAKYVSETSKNPTWTELTDEIADMLGICRWNADWDEHSRAIWNELDLHMEDWFEDDEVEGDVCRILLSFIVKVRFD